MEIILQYAAEQSDSQELYDVGRNWKFSYL